MKPFHTFTDGWSVGQIASDRSIALCSGGNGECQESLVLHCCLLRIKLSNPSCPCCRIKSGTVRNTESARVSFPPLVIPSAGSTAQNPEYVWRTDLVASEQYWKEWFTGMTQKFLSSRTAKLLILAGTDRLDKDMTIAQMQGKFQMLVFPNSGHAVQEDDPGRMARELVAFWKRNERLVLPPRVPIVPHKH